VLRRRRARLQRRHDGAEVDARHFDCGVVDAGEPENTDEIARTHRMSTMVVPVARDRPDPRPQVPVGDGDEPRQEAKRRLPRFGIWDDFAGTLTQGGPVGIALHDRGHHLGDAQAGTSRRLCDLCVGTRDAELLVGVVEPFTPLHQAFPLLLLRTGILHVSSSDERHGHRFLSSGRPWIGDAGQFLAALPQPP
jgi:hypothetical protein